MTSRSRTLGILLVTVWACGGRTPDVERSILEVVDRYYQQSSAANWRALSTLFWSGAHLATIWSSTGGNEVGVMVTTVEGLVRQGLRLGAADHFQEWRIDARVRVEGSLAHAWVRHGARRTDEDGDDRAWTGVDGFTLMSLEGEWRITALAFDGSNHRVGDP